MKSVMVWFLIFASMMTASAQTVRTNSLASLQMAYSNATARIDSDFDHQRNDALIRYEKDLGAILQALKMKGDLEGYVAVDKELKRFQSEKTAPTNLVSVHVAGAKAIYVRSILAAETESTRLTTDLRRRYVGALTSLIKDLLLRDKIEDAKLAGDVRKGVEAELKGLQLVVVTPSVVSSNEPVAEQSSISGARMFEQLVGTWKVATESPLITNIMAIDSKGHVWETSTAPMRSLQFEYDIVPEKEPGSFRSLDIKNCFGIVVTFEIVGDKLHVQRWSKSKYPDGKSFASTLAERISKTVKRASGSRSSK